MRKITALNVKKKSLQMLLAFVELALQFVARIAGKIIDAKISLTKTSAKLVTQEFLKIELEQSTNESMNPSLLKSTMKRLEKNMKNRTPRSSSKSKTPEDPIYICKTCAGLKHMSKAERVWIREGICDFCLERSYICQAIEYTAADASTLH